MPIDRFLIAPLTDGLQNNVRPWLISDKAAAQLLNLYLFRGRFRKRPGAVYMGDPGTQLSSRLRVLVVALDGAGNTPAGTFVPLSGGVPIVTPAIGQMFSAGTQLFTVNALGNPAAMLISDTATLATFDTTTGEVVINAGVAYAGVNLYYYPALPVMGLTQFNTEAINDELSIGFDTRFAYQYLSTGWSRLSGEVVAGDAKWSGGDTNFFWACNYRGATDGLNLLFVTNNYFNSPNYDGIRYYNANTGNWATLLPQYGPTGNDIIVAALIVVPFQNRLLLFNIVQYDGATYTRYVNRMAYCADLSDPTTATNWRGDIPGLGDTIDCPVTEAIVTVEFIKNRLIVGMETSTWEIAFTGNQVAPFVWQQINTEYGSESTFSAVPFDKYMLSIGNVGVMSCNGANVQRIDDLIPDEVFRILNGTDGVLRVHGIRDYFIEVVYWSFPTEGQTPTQTYPTRILVYNYKANTWSFFEDSVTTFGYFNRIGSISWEEATMLWQNADQDWVDPSFLSGFRKVIAGNQEGYTFIMEPGAPRNYGMLQITDATAPNSFKVINHNLSEGDYILIEGCVGLTGINDIITQVDAVTDANNFTIEPETFSGSYLGGGTVSRVNNLSFLSKQYNFYVEQGRNAYISRVDFLVDKTNTGQVLIDSFVSSSSYSLVQGGQASGALVGTNVLETSPYPAAIIPFEAQQERLWHTIYLQAEGECIQISLYMNNDQMRNPNISLIDFQLHAMCFFAQPTSNRLQ